MNGTLVALMFVLLFVLLSIGMPIGTPLGISVAILVAATQITSLEYITQFLYIKIADFTVLGLPFFLLTGDIMDDGGLSKRMMAMADSPIGNVTGALGAVAVIVCMLFSAVPGSAPATAAAIDAIMTPQMVYGGYDKGYTVGPVRVVDDLNITMPPSFPMILYGMANDVSIGDMFLAGWGPSFAVGGMFIFINRLICKKRSYKSPIPREASLKLFVESMQEGKWALLMLIIILSGTYSGAFSPTEANVVPCVYGLIMGLFLYEELDYRKTLPMLRSKVNFLGGMVFCPAPADALGAVFTYPGYTTVIKNFFLSISSNPYIIVLLIYTFPFVANMFVQTTPIIVIISPLLLPVAGAVDIDPVHSGIITTLALAVAFVTPPVAYNLFVDTSISGMSIDKISKAAISFIVGLMLAEIVVSFILQISMPPVNLLGQAAEKADLKEARPGPSPGISDSVPVNGVRRGV